MKKISLILLICSLLTFTACGNTSTSETKTSAGGSAASTEQSETSKAQYVPAKANYEGYNFNILARDNQWDCIEVDFDEPQADVIYDAVYKRNSAVEEYYNVKINGVLKGEDMHGTAKKSILAGTYDYDMVFAPLFSAAAMGTEGLLYNYNEISTIDLSNPWWDQNIIDDLQMFDKVYFMTGDIGVRSKDNLWIILFNNPILTDLGLESPYDHVKNGTWTIDKFSEMALNAVSDLDGNGEFDQNDRYGLITTVEGGKNFFYATGERVIDNKNGELTISVNNERTQTAIEKIVKMFTEDNIAYYPPTWQDAEITFSENKGLFYSEIVTHIINLRYMEADFGILPTPKLSEEQDNYYTHCASNGTAVCIPSNSPDIERSGMIIEALGYYGMEFVTPAFDEVALQAKYSRDAQSGEMLNIIWNSVRYDVGYLYNIGGMSDVATALINKKSTDLQSYVEKNMSKAEKDIAKLIENYTEE